jgi:LPXTG-motif cell wall-anchored protein
METPVWAPYVAALLGLVLVFFFFQTPGLNFRNMKASEFANAYFILGALLVLVGIILFVRRNQENT